jgi:hypothetical protein
MPQKEKGKGPETRKWAFLIYIAGDNNLSDAGLEDIQELCDEGSSSDIHVGLEVDTYGEHTGSIRYEIGEPDWTGKAYRTVIERLGEKDSGDPATLREFLEWGFERYPAQNTVLVIWNHGSGFRTVRRDIAYDDFGSSLNMPEIEIAFTAAGVTPKNKISILGFDACLMSMLEIVHHFKDLTEFIVGSQQTEPGDGWPYNAVLNRLKTLPNAANMSSAIVEEYMKDYKKTGITNITQSAISTDKTQQAVDSVSKLGDELAGICITHYKKLKRIRTQCQNYEMADYIDLVHFCAIVEKEIDIPEIRTAARDTIDATLKCVVVSKCNGKAVENSNGLSIWFPAETNLYHNYRSKYLELKCNAKSFGWVDFLDLYHS